MLEKLPVYQDEKLVKIAYQICRWHHERYDGKGYPRRIAGEDIPATARVLCVADSFDAMTSKRAYKKAYPVETAKEILLEKAGTQFDPEMAQAFVQCLNIGRIKLVHGEFSGEMQQKETIGKQNRA